MHLSTSILLVAISAAASSLVHALPIVARRDINISHKSLVNGTSTTHSIDPALLPAELAQAIAGSDININLTTDRRRSRKRSQGVNNSTINLTVISKRAQQQHHNINIDASSNGQGGVGGIHNSTVNINLNSASSSNKERRTVHLGDHSVIVDVSSASSDENARDGGIEDSTVHVNILPPRALHKSTGHHSIVVDSSSAASSDSTTTTTGDHSAVVDTSSSSSSSTASNGGTGIKGSTINLTVIAPSKKDNNDDEVEAPIPSMARLSKRSIDAFADWSAKVQRSALEGYQSETDALAAAAEADAGLSITRRDHSSHKI